MLNHLLAKSGKRAMMLVSVLMLAMATFAVPAKPGLRRLLTLTDGTTVSATLVGDEHAHYWLGADGKAYQSAGDNVYQSVDLQAVKQHGVQRRAAANQRRTRRLAPRKVGEVGSITGQKKGLIILVNFSDVTFKSANNNALYQRIANEVNFSYGNFKGSIYDYFYAQSEGKFELTFDVVGPVTVANTQSYYGDNDSEGNDKYPAKMVIEALQAVNAQVNFADYDWNGDNEVEQVYVVYAGQGEADGGADETIWPHEYDLASAKIYGDGSGAQTLDGVRINTYACGSELNGNNNIAGIGTMCHEFSHCLGYPDFYDTDYSGGQGMGYWDLMDSGSYNGDGYQPAGYTSYERWVAGWKEPIELTYSQSIANMKALQNKGSNAYIIYNKGNRDEYYLLENRQKTGWDTDLPGDGLLILHVDYDATVWSNNQPNDDPSHQRMTWIAADNNYQYTMSNGTKYYTFSGMANDPFPYDNKNSFGKNTTPAATLYNNNSDGTKYLDSSIENITQNSDGTISFDFNGLSNVYMPNFSPEGGRYGEAQTVSISCPTSGATIYYTTNGNTPTTSSSTYSSPLTISETTTVKAIAVKNGEQSGVATATYTIVDPYILTDESLSFNTPAGTPQTKQLEVLSEALRGNITLTLTDPNNVFSLSSSTISKTEEDAIIDVTFTPTVVGQYTGSITLSSTGATPVTVSLSGTATQPAPAAPGNLALSNVATTSMTASWSAVADATSYELDVVEGSSFEASTGATVLTADFSDTTGWTLSGTGTYTSSPYIGNSSPSIKFDGNSDYAVSPDFSSGTKLQFWAYGNGGSGSTFAISGLVNGTWTDIGTVTIDNGGKTYEVNLPAGTSQVRFDFTKSVNCALDDVVITGSGSAPASISGYPISVGNVTSYAITGLTSNTGYAVRVRAMNAAGNSDWSTAVTTTTTTSSTTPALAYYQSADGKKGSALKTSMFNIIKTPSVKSYDYLWNAFFSTDVHPEGDPNAGKIWDMYSDITNYTPVTSGSEYSKEGDCYNREHSWPQSWFNENSPMVSDLHHIYPTDGYVNGRRSNYPFGETNGETYKSAHDFSKLGTCTYPGYTGTVFEPADEYKGDFARTYFYMVTCYQDKLATWYNGNADGVQATIDGSTYPAFTTWQLNMLMEWAKNDPVSEKETNRNNAVYAIQNNRNPFIDYPGLQEYIWGICTNDAFSYNNYVEPVYSNKQNVTMSFSLATATATIGQNFTAPTLSTNPTGLAVTYTSSDTSVAIVNENTGVVTLVAAGTTTITASFAGNNSYNSGTAQYTLTVSASQSSSGNEFALVTSASEFVEGDYLIVYDGVAMNTTVSSDRLQYNAVTPTNDVITTENAAIIWHIAPSGNYYTIYNAGENKYAASTGVKNKAQLLADGTNDMSLWTVSTGSTFDFTNKKNTANSVNAKLRRNTTYGFACYSSDTGGALSLYKRTSSSTPTNVAPTWSALPTDATVTVGQTYVLDLNNYVSGTPTPTISMASAANATLNNGVFSFTPTATGEHSFSFTATNSEGSANATLTVTVTLTAPTVPAGLALSEVTATSLTASWSAVNYADSYEIDIVKGSSFEASAGETVLTADFSSTTGWTLSGTGTYTGAGYYGAGSPSIKFDDTGDYAISPNFGSGSKLQFWAYGNNGSGSTFAISGLVNNSWTDIETVSIAQGSDTYEVNLPAGTSQVRFNFTKSVNCALDDVVVYGPSNSPESVDGYPKTVGNTSTSITGLTPETQYAVRVRAVNTAGNSDWSSIATATTTVANSAPVWSAFPANANITVGEDYDLTISDYVSGIPTPTITMTASGSNDADFDEGYFVFCPTEAGTFNFTFTATNSEGSANATLTVTVNQPPVTVPTLAVTEAAITATSAPVTWTACDGVASYTLQLASDNQFTTGGSGGAGETLTETFTNITFTTTGSSYTDQTISGGDLGTWTATSCRGDQGSPVIRYAGTLTSPTIANGVAAVEFDYDWPFSESGSCDIELYVGGTLMGTATVTGGTAGTATYTLDSPVSGPTTIEFLNKASSNKRMRVTEVRITSPSSGSSGSGSLINEYTVSDTEYTFNGLTPETTYYARVKGNADWSNVVEFTTTPAYTALELANNSDNSDDINTAAIDGGLYNVTLTGRTLWKDGAWNTLCLPFDVTIAGSVLDGTGVDVRALSSAEFAAGTLTLNFTNEGAVTAITAGTPYIIRWAGNGTDNIVNPTFSGVTIDKTIRNKTCDLGDGKSITFCGTYGYRQFTEIDKSILFFGTNSTLYYPPVGGYIAAQRAYFTLEGITAGDPTAPSNPIKGFVLNFGDETETGIVSMDNGKWTMDNEAGAWYTIDGRRVNGKPTQRGIYINNGRKVVIK